MKRFFNDFRKYYKYTIYSVKSELNSEVANSYLGALWWILDPLFFMLIYTFISTIVFKSTEPFFPVFVFIGLTLWNFFTKIISLSTKLVTSNKDTVTKVYIPKFVLLIIKIGTNLFKMFISWILVVILMIIFKVPLSFNILNMIPVLIVLVIVSFGFASILMHFGVFVEDLSNLVNIFLKLVFYLSGIFYNISKKVPGIYGKLLTNCNPIGFLIEAARKSLLNSDNPNYIVLLVWLLIGVLFSIIGLRTIYKFENSYVKVIKG